MVWNLIAYTQAAGPNSSTTSPDIDTTGADLLLLGLSSWPNGGGATVSDNKGNTWIQAVAINTSVDVYVRLYYVRGGTVGSGHNFTCSGSADYGAIVVFAFSGSATSPLDQTNSNQNGGSGTSVTTGSITPTEDGELLISLFGGGNFSSGYTIDNSFVMPLLGNDWHAGNEHQGIAMAYLAQGTAVAINPTWSWTTSGQHNAAVIASFKAVPSLSLVRDANVGTEFPGALTRSSTPNAEWGSQTYVDRGIRTEWAASSSRNVAAPTEWVSGAFGDRKTPSEWLSEAFRDVAAPDEALWQAFVYANLTGEWTALAFVDIRMPTESLAQAVIDRGVLGEWLGSSLLRSGALFELTSALVGTPLAPVEFAGEVLFVSEKTVPIEWLSAFHLDRGLPIEAVLDAAVDCRIAMEQLASALTDRALSGEFIVSLGADEFVSIEVEGNILLVLSDQVLPIEWSALPGTVRVSLERLLASPGKRRILGTPGRVRLLKRQ
jgi:hypothetical protein